MKNQFGPHFKALLKKNYIIWKRNLCCSISEVLIPILFAFIFIILRNGNPVEDVAETIYSTQPFTYKPTIDSDGLTLIKNCNAIKNGGKVGLVPSNDAIIQ